MNYQPWLQFIAALGGSIIGAYLAVRVELATIKERIRGQGGRLDSHEKRIERLEDRRLRAD